MKRTMLKVYMPTLQAGVDADVALFRFDQHLYGQWYRSDDSVIAPFMTCSTCDKLAVGGNGLRLSCGDWRCFVKFYWVAFRNRIRRG